MSCVAVTFLAVNRLLDDRALETVMLRLLDDAASSVPLQALAIVTAAGVGAIHALGPGHGKVLIGAYLASSHGTPRDALALGGLIGAMHTGSVLVLGIAFASLQQVPGGERLEGWLRLLSGLAVMAVGAVLLARHTRLLRRRRTRGALVGGLDGHNHTEPRDHQHRGGSDHHHDLPEGVDPLSRAGVLALATSGGLLPSPAAFVMLATAIAIGRSGHGLALVLAFSLGLAVTLTAVGLGIVWGRSSLDRIEHAPARLMNTARALPLVAAAVVLAGGALLTGAAALRLL